MTAYQIKPRPLEPQAKPIRDERYRKWVRTQPCAVIGCKRIPSEFAHTGAKGRGASVKSCDLEGIRCVQFTTAPGHKRITAMANRTGRICTG